MFGENSTAQQQFEIRAQKAARAQSMAESTANERVTNQRIASELGLSKQSIWREFNMQQTQQSQRNSQQQSQMLAQGRFDAKDAASQARQESVMRSINQQQAQARADAKTNASMQQNSAQNAKTAHQTANAARFSAANAPKNAPNTPQALFKGGQNVLQNRADSAVSAKNVQKSENSVRLAGDGFSYGTQNAIKEKINMSAFFASQNFDASHGQSRGRDNQEDLQQELAGLAGNSRLGALVEELPVQNYNEISLQQTILPKIQEVIMNLINRQQSWARVVIPLDSSTKMVLNFSAQAKKVRVQLSGISSSLREMIEQGWDLLVNQSAQNGIELETPIFERNTYVN